MCDARKLILDPLIIRVADRLRKLHRSARPLNLRHQGNLLLIKYNPVLCLHSRCTTLRDAQLTTGPLCLLKW